MRCFFCLGLFLAGLVLPLHAADPDARPLAGSWRYVPERSTALSAWGALKLTIAVNGSVVTLTREYDAGRRNFRDSATIDLSKSVNIVPIEWWPDNRHIGAYIGGDHTKKFRAKLFENGRLLRTSADVVLATQQGEHTVNILSDYKVSANGQQLTLIELRSTRNDPIVYIFKRVDARDDETSKGAAE